MLALIGSFLVKLLGNGILQPILAHLDQKAAAQRDITVAGIGADQQRDLALVQGQIEANKLKALDRDRTWLLMWIIALPPAIHSGALYLDSFAWSLPLYGTHAVGSWNVVAPPGAYATLQLEILKSFFYVAPALVGVKAIGQAATAYLGRR
jgi:hypothetical protein